MALKKKDKIFRIAFGVGVWLFMNNEPKGRSVSLVETGQQEFIVAL